MITRLKMEHSTWSQDYHKIPVTYWFIWNGSFSNHGVNVLPAGAKQFEGRRGGGDGYRCKNTIIVIL